MIHRADPFGKSDERVGMWMMRARGSGVFYFTGRTHTFADHNEACDRFGVPRRHLPRLSAAAARAGYDTLAFSRHADHISYPCDAHHRPEGEGAECVACGPSQPTPCDRAQSGLLRGRYMGFELLATRLQGTYACGAAYGAPATIRSARGACECDARAEFLNCATGERARLLFNSQI